MRKRLRPFRGATWRVVLWQPCSFRGTGSHRPSAPAFNHRPIDSKHRAGGGRSSANEYKPWPLGPTFLVLHCRTVSFDKIELRGETQMFSNLFTRRAFATRFATLFSGL